MTKRRKKRNKSNKKSLDDKNLEFSREDLNFMVGCYIEENIASIVEHYADEVVEVLEDHGYFVVSDYEEYGIKNVPNMRARDADSIYC